MKPVAWVTFFIAIASTASSSVASNTPAWYSDRDPAQALNWKFSDDPANRCGGYFAESPLLTKHPIPPPLKTTTTNITADRYQHIGAKNLNILSGHVLVTQPGRIFKADKAYIYSDAKSGEISQIILEGHVSLAEHGRLSVSDKAMIHPQTDSLQMDHIFYHLRHTQRSNASNTPEVTLDSWGRADSADHPDANITILKNATYSNCSPNNPLWVLHGQEIKLNKAKGWGKAENMWLTIHQVPVFYFPYFRFPITTQRQSGFLYPSYGHSTENGWNFSLPFYWNLAPNYDLTITPNWIEKRGILLGNDFRFLTARSKGTIGVNILANDKLFAAEKQTIINQYPNNAQYAPFIAAAEKDSNTRYFLAINEQAQWNNQWNSNLTLNYASDDYYFQDLGGSTVNTGLVNQLPNQFTINYLGRHWTFTGLLQAYQTLHPINNNAPNQYQRLPELDASGFYPHFWHGVDFSAGVQSTYFNYDSSYSTPQVSGERFHLRPSISLPRNSAGAYFTPQLAFDFTHYQLNHLTAGLPASTNRLLPIFDIDSGLHFQRYFTLDHTYFIQTLEPELMYLWVPYKNQSTLPNFDTQQLPLTYDQLFSINQFSGFDRIQNANQVSIGIQSRVLRAQDNYQQLSLGIGMIGYLAPRKVCLTTGCSIDNHPISPITAQLTYNITPQWVASGSAAWDTELKHIASSSSALTYSAGNSLGFTIGQNFINQSPTSSKSNLLNLGASLPLFHHWTAIGYYYYDEVNHRSNDAFAGLEYTGCGWAVRIISRKTYIGNNLTPDSTAAQYDHTYFIQLLLTGLGTVGRSPADFLNNDLPFYQNQFAGGA